MTCFSTGWVASTPDEVTHLFDKIMYSPKQPFAYLLTDKDGAPHFNDAGDLVVRLSPFKVGEHLRCCALYTDSNINPNAESDAAISILLSAADFGVTPFYEDGTPTPNRKRLIEAAKFIHYLTSSEDFEKKHALAGSFQKPTP